MYFKNCIDNEEIIMHMHIYLSTGMFIPELFVVENLQKQPTHLSVGTGTINDGMSI